MKKLLAILLSFTVLAAACSSDSDDSSDATAAPDDTSDAGDASPIEIEMWIAFNDDARLNYTKERAAEFNEKHPDYEVVVTPFDSYNTVFEQTTLAIDDGNPPEVIHFFEAATQDALDAIDANGDPIFKSVTAAAAGRSEILGEPVVLDDVVSAATNYYTIDGSLFSMPWNTSSTTMFSNMDILAAAGIDEPPTTWAGVEEACDAIAALPDAPDNCISWPNHGWFFEQALGQAGVDLANNDNGRSARATEVALNSDAAIDYVQWWSDLEDSGDYVYTGTQRDWAGSSAAFNSQNVAMLVFSSSDTTVITDDGAENGFDVRTSFMPYNQERDYVGNLIGGATLWMTNGLDQASEDGALAFMNFFSNPENAALWHKTTGYIPITNEATALLETEGWFAESPNSAVASEQLNAAANTPASTGALLGNFVAIRDVVTAAIEDILVNDVDVTERMNSAQDEAQSLLDDYNELFG